MSGQRWAQCKCSSQPCTVLPGALSHSQAHLCSDLPVARAFASSRLKGNGQPGLLCAEAQWSSPPSASPKASNSAVPVETWVVPPAAVSSPCPGFKNALPRCGPTDHTAKQTEWRVKSHDILYSFQDPRSSRNEAWKRVWLRREHQCV